MATDQGKASDEPSDCTVHTHPVPAGELSRYSVEGDAHAEQDIRNYVQGQARDEVVQHVERVKREAVFGQMYEIWDVTTDKDRWWVLTDMTNLYSQRHFPSLDYTLSFHIGLMARLRDRSGRADAEDPSPFDEVIRRMDQAERHLGHAVEAEDYQAVGMQLREALLSLIAAVRRRITIPEDSEVPQAANFIAWSDLLMNILCGGGSNRELRQYLKTLAKETWQLANWLTHHRNATEIAASVALHSCQTIVGHFIQLVQRISTNQLERCPICSSRNIRTHFDIEILPDGHYFSSCGSCDWDSHPGHGPEET
ncbi:gamma-glutamylcyclotransferase [Xanthomonas arboricola]|uniref:gamma-glutamylcyclotransferase n=1 Tax=Xanthomonas arboricola TaxID=56448 RepID=UPI0014301485|nr:gamma-glutamylcyclotransferase [Xanthomonas arboricola]NJB93506.1 hypothetical protein [Xanthomonas arboricola]